MRKRRVHHVSASEMSKEEVIDTQRDWQQIHARTSTSLSWQARARAFVRIVWHPLIRFARLDTGGARGGVLARALLCATEELIAITNSSVQFISGVPPSPQSEQSEERLGYCLPPPYNHILSVYKIGRYQCWRVSASPSTHRGGWTAPAQDVLSNRCRTREFVHRREQNER